MNIEALRKKIGTLMGSSNWYLLDQDRINQFAVVTQDEQFIHTDPEKAAKTPFGTTIAHGFLTLALLPAMGGDVIPKLDGHLMSVNYGFEKLRFLSPVPAGSRSIFGLTRNTGIPEMVKAAIDSVAYQTKDLLLAMEKDSGLKIKVIRQDPSIGSRHPPPTLFRSGVCEVLFEFPNGQHPQSP